MQLKITRSQKLGGVVTKAMVFCIDARAELTPVENANIIKYGLGLEVLYSSEASKRHEEAAALHGKAASAGFDITTGAGLGGVLMGGLKSIAAGTMAMFSLNITIMSLQNGQHIECKSLVEVMAAEDALKEACANLKNFLDTAATFDGREQLWGFENGTAELVTETTSPNPTLLIDPSGGGGGEKATPLSFGGGDISPAVLADSDEKPGLSRPLVGDSFELPPPMPAMENELGEYDGPFPPPGHLPGPSEAPTNGGGGFVAPIRISEPKKKPTPKFFG